MAFDLLYLDISTKQACQTSACLFRLLLYLADGGVFFGGRHGAVAAKVMEAPCGLTFSVYALRRREVGSRNS